MKRCSFSFLQTHLLSVLSLLLFVICYTVIIITLSVFMIYEDNVHSYSYRDILVSTIVLLVMYVYIAGNKRFTCILQLSVEYTRCVKYKCNKIQKIWIVSG